MRADRGANLEARRRPMHTPEKTADIPYLKRFSQFLHIELPEVWVRFLLALVGLVLAFASALFLYRLPRSR